MKVSLIEPDSPHWRRVLSDVDHDFSHLSGFTALSARKVKGEPIAFLAEEGDSRFMVPLIVRRLGTDVLPGMSQLFDATCAYGYPGPILHTAHARDDHFVDRALHTSSKCCEDAESSPRSYVCIQFWLLHWTPLAVSDVWFAMATQCPLIFL